MHFENGEAFAKVKVSQSFGTWGHCFCCMFSIKLLVRQKNCCTLRIFLYGNTTNWASLSKKNHDNRNKEQNNSEHAVLFMVDNLHSNNIASSNLIRIKMWLLLKSVESSEIFFFPCVTSAGNPEGQEGPILPTRIANWNTGFTLPCLLTD